MPLLSKIHSKSASVSDESHNSTPIVNKHVSHNKDIPFFKPLSHWQIIYRNGQGRMENIGVMGEEDNNKRRHYNVMYTSFENIQYTEKEKN